MRRSDPDEEARIRVGQTLIAIRTARAWPARHLRGHFRARALDGHPDITVRLRVERTGATGIPDSLFEDKSADGQSFTIGGGIVRGAYLPASGEVDVVVDDRLLAGRLIRVFEQLLYQAFYSDLRNRDGRTLLVHASGVVHAGSGYLFTGASGAGKSTIAGLSSHDIVLNDEICLVTLRGPQATLESTPFNGFYRRKREGSAPLRGIFLLAQAREHTVEPTGAGDAVSALLPQLVPTIGLAEPITRQTLERMLDLATELAGCVPVFRLRFARDAGFWKKIDEISGPQKDRGEA